ncbi:guanylate kinase [bacterium]|nr:guanylate kinase [bacterium]
MGKIVVISGPSGSGKTTLCTRLLEIFPELTYSISATTRPKREYETEGRDYFFIDKKKFKEMINNNEFIEWEEVHENFYGSLYSDIEKRLKISSGVIMDIDPKGGLSIKKKYPDALLIFLRAPSVETLIDRLIKRRTEHSTDIDIRIKRVKEEYELSKQYDYVVENDVLDDAFQEITAIINEAAQPLF